MSRILRFFRILVGLVRCLARNPRRTARLLELIPSVEQGSRFGTTMGSPPNMEPQSAPPVPANPLLSYFENHREGPGIFKWQHYFEVYHEHFRRFVGQELHVMEVGIYSGGSLRMWREYFGERCHVYGVDIEEACKTYESTGVEVLVGDQADRRFWASVRQKVPLLDIIIDDGGHTPEQQRITLEEMLPHLRPGGVYLCEDIHGEMNTYAAFVQGLADGLNSAHPGGMEARAPDGEYVATGLQHTVASVHLYPFLVVIQKRERKLDHLFAARRGTQWQPFL